MSLKIKIPNHKIINCYYAIAILAYFVAIYFPFIRVGLLMSLVIIIGIFILYGNKKLKLRNSLDIIVLLYILYNILTIVFFIPSNIPLIVFFKEFSNSILPIILFYFFGKLNHDKSFYKITLYSVSICLLLSFYYQLTLPISFMQRLDVIDGTGTNPLGYLSQYSSFLGITATGSLGAIASFLAFNLMHETNYKKGKILFFLCTIAVILALRRGSIYSLVFSILLFDVIILFKFRRYLKLITFQFIIALLIIFFLIDFDSDSYLFFIDRVSSISSAIAERSDSWYNGLAKTFSIVTGDGLGRYGHKVVSYSDIYIPDGNYFRMIAEIGILGFLIFVSIILASIYKGFSKIRTHYVQLIIIFIVCLQSIGSDMFSFQLVAPIFWYSVGACNKIEHSIKNIKQT
jgi:hypothetical protein